MSDIAINPVTRRVQFTGNTGTGPFAFTFNILTDSDIAVYKGTVLLTLTTDYTVSINANGTGSITLTAALIASDVLTIIGGRELSRTTDFVTAGDLLASSLNEQLDSNVIMTQQLDEKLGRGLFVNPGDVFTDLELPLKDARKGTVLGFNATTGDPEPGPEIGDVDTIAAISADIKTLAEIQDGTVATDAITNVNTIRTDVTTVSGISGNVTTVAGISSDVTTVAADGSDIGTVAGSISNVNNVGGSISSVNTVAGSISSVNTVSGDIADVNTVAGISSDVSTVSGISADVTTVAADGTDIGVVAGISSDVTTVSGISANVTTVAGINAAVSTVAADQADIGVVSTNIASVNTVSTNIASINTNTANITDIQNASANAATATTQAGIATTQAGIATTKASEASASEVAAEAAKVAAEAALDEFTDIYLGAKASDPTTDNDGNALTAGDQYFNTTINALKIYNGSAWQAAAIDSSGFVEATGDTMTGPLDVQSTITSDGLTVDTNTLHVDSTNNRVGIGTSSPSFKQHTVINGATGDIAGFGLTGNANDPVLLIKGDASNQTLTFRAGSSTGTYPAIAFDMGTTGEAMRIDSSGNVGINASTVSPIGSSNTTLQINGANTTEAGCLRLRSTNGGVDAAFWANSSAAYFGTISNDPLTFRVNNTEAMRIDSSGNLLVGKTSVDTTTDGLVMRERGQVYATSSGNTPLILNIKTSDGDIAQFRKDNNIVGNIGVNSGDQFYFAAADGMGIKVDSDNTCVEASNASGADNDATVNLGSAGTRWKDLYLSGGLYLGGTGSANYLDDYEEGTHQTSVTMSGSGTVTLNTSFDRFSYTKVGRLVTITGNPRISSVSSPVGNLLLTLPFTAAGGQTDECRSGGIMRYYDQSAGAGSYSKPVAWSIQEASSTLVLDVTNTNGNNPTPAASDELYFSLSYITT